MLDKQLLSAWWPEASRRVTAHLLRKGVSEADAADAVQEAAAKALTADLDVADVDELSRWTTTVAWRSCIDAYRRTSRTAPALPADVADTADVAAAVEGRIDVARTLTAMASLSAADRAALAATLAPGEQAASRKEAVRDAVRLFRARARLMAVVGKLGAAAAAAWRVLKRAFAVEPAARAATAAGVLAFAILTLDLPQQPHAEDPPPAAPHGDDGAGQGQAVPASSTSPASPAAGAPAPTQPGLAPAGNQPAGPPPAAKKGSTLNWFWNPDAPNKPEDGEDDRGLVKALVVDYSPYRSSSTPVGACVAFVTC